MAANEFIAFRGDGFTALRDQGQNKETLESDVIALREGPAGGTRITREG